MSIFLSFSQTDCLDQLKIVMQILLKHPKYDDILALGTLLFWETKNTAFSVAEVRENSVFVYFIFFFMRKNIAFYHIYI